MSICKTTDGGTTWAVRRSLGIGGDYRTSCWDIAVAPSDSAIVYAGGQDDGYVKIFFSINAGSSWTDITDDLASMHSRDDILYAIWVSPYYPYSLLVGTSRGVYKTIAPIGRSSGITGWSPTPLRNPTRAFAYYQAKETVYAGTESEGVYFTSDGGSSWHQLNDDGAGFREWLALCRYRWRSSLAYRHCRCEQ